MSFIRNIASVFHRWPLLITALVISGALTLPSPLSASGEKPQSGAGSGATEQSGPNFENDLGFQLRKKIKPGGECMDLSPKVQRAVFHGLQRIFLFIDVKPNFYDYSVQCHGHEIDCIGESTGKIGTPEERAKNIHQHIQELVNTYKSYPVPLHRDNLTKIFKDAITANLLPWVQPGPGPACTTPEVQVLDNKSLWTTKFDAGSLLVWVKLSIVYDTQPRLAIVRHSLYRAGLTDKDLLSETGSNPATAFTLDLPEDKMTAMIRANTSALYVNWGATF